jgi:hypothetical protein
MAQSDLFPSDRGYGEERRQDKHGRPFCPSRQPDDETSSNGSGLIVRPGARVRRPLPSNWIFEVFLAPCLVLCGTTALFLDREERSTDREIRVVDPHLIAGTPLDGFPNARNLAAEVIDALNARFGSRVVRAVNAGGASFTRPILVTTRAEGHEHAVWFNPDSGAAWIRSTAAAGEHPREWPARGRIILSDSPRDRLVHGVRALLDKLEIEPEPESVGLRDPPDLVFTVEAEGHQWLIAYNLQTGGISARPADSPGDDRAGRSLVTARHLLVGDPLATDPRWFLAISMNVLAATMAIGAASGALARWTPR